MNLSDIKRVTKPVIYIENQSFLRDKFVKFMNNKFMDWRVFCAENQIEIVPEVQAEIGKFMALLKTENKIKKKDFNSYLVFGADIDLQQRAEKWFDEYL